MISVILVVENAPLDPISQARNRRVVLVPQTLPDRRWDRYHGSVSLDPTWLFLSLIPSGIGFVLFVYGKKQQRWPQLAAGLGFMVYPYFTASNWSLTIVGIALGGALWLALRAGW